MKYILEELEGRKRYPTGPRWLVNVSVFISLLIYSIIVYHVGG